MKNPFSTATNQPKIPDGKCPASMGGKRHLTTQINFGEWDTYDIIISPRFDSPITWATAARAENGATTGPNDTNLHQPANKGSGTFNDNHPFNRAWVAGANSNEIVQASSAEISKMRIVSQGTKITLTNSTDDNDGWFEAFRFMPQPGINTYKQVQASAVTGTPYTPSAEVDDIMFGNTVGDGSTTSQTTFDMNLASKSNYVTGKLRNIHRYVWTNKPYEKDVDFKDINTDLFMTNPPSTLDCTSRAFQDWDYDVIWIRVHGRGLPAAQEGGCCLPTKLMVHLCQNVEAVFGEQNLLNSYMTKSPTYGTKRGNYSLPYKPRYTRRRTYKRKTPMRRTRRKVYKV